MSDLTLPLYVSPATPMCRNTSGVLALIGLSVSIHLKGSCSRGRGFDSSSVAWISYDSDVSSDVLKGRVKLMFGNEPASRGAGQDTFLSTMLR